MNVIFIYLFILNGIPFLFSTPFPLTMVWEVLRAVQCVFATIGSDNIFHKRVVFANWFRTEAYCDHNATANLICYLHTG